MPNLITKIEDELSKAQNSLWIKLIKGKNVVGVKRVMEALNDLVDEQDQALSTLREELPEELFEKIYGAYLAYGDDTKRFKVLLMVIIKKICGEAK